MITLNKQAGGWLLNNVQLIILNLGPKSMTNRPRIRLKQLLLYNAMQWYMIQNAIRRYDSGRGSSFTKTRFNRKTINLDLNEY